MVRTRPLSDVAECPICLERAKFAIETNCGHLYCGTCIIQAWNSRPSMAPMSCPYCKQDVTLLLSCYTEDEENDINAITLAEKNKINTNIASYNRLYSGHPRSIWGQFYDLPTILRHVWADIFTWQGLAFFYRVRIIICFVLAFLYAVFPFDLVPEGLLGIFGFIDDLIITAFLLIQIGIFYRNNFADV